jgi:hypothetical protein
MGAEHGEKALPTMGFVRGYFAGWSDARAGRAYGGTRPAGWDVVRPNDLHTEGICGVIAPNQGPAGEPLACAWPDGHLPETPHSWAWVPTLFSGANGAGGSAPVTPSE